MAHRLANGGGFDSTPRPAPKPIRPPVSRPTVALRHAAVLQAKTAKPAFVDVPAFIKGIGIGFAVAAPVGPMSVLCMRRTLVQGWRQGFATGLGIATGDGAYAVIAALGLAGVSRFMLAYDRPLHVLAGLFLVYLGFKTLLARTPAPHANLQQALPASGYLSALLLTLTNPPTIISFAAIFTVIAPVSALHPDASALTVVGVFIGSTLWWLILTIAVKIVRHAMGRRTISWIDRISGGLLSLFGAFEIRRAL